MARHVKPAPRPRYQQTYPEGLATAEELRALGLRPGTSEPDAILRSIDMGTEAGSVRCLKGEGRADHGTDRAAL